LMIASSEMTPAPAAAIQRVTAVMMAHGVAPAGASTVQTRTMDLKPGATHEITWTVTPDKTADAMGNRGVKVFATPWLIGMLEDVCGAMIKPHLAPAATTVGTMVEMRHLAATPVGMTARAKATLLETDGRRFLFSVEAWDAKDKIAEGRHERVVIPDLAKFLERTMKKGQA
jgi:fluoroacetyl-CoA thioesterase